MIVVSFFFPFNKIMIMNTNRHRANKRIFLFDKFVERYETSSLISMCLVMVCMRNYILCHRAHFSEL